MQKKRFEKTAFLRIGKSGMTITCSPEQYEEWNDAATWSGLDFSGWARSVLLRDARASAGHDLAPEIETVQAAAPAGERSRWIRDRLDREARKVLILRDGG